MVKIKKIPEKLAKFDETCADENKINRYLSRINLDSLDAFVSKNPIKIKLMIPVDMYDNVKKVIGIHPFDDKKPEILKTHKTNGDKMYHLMDVGGYSNISEKSEEIEVISITYNVIKKLLITDKIYKDLFKRYDNLVGKKGQINVVIHYINNTSLYIKNELMSSLFPSAYLDNKREYIFLFNNTKLEKRFKINYRTKGKTIFPKTTNGNTLYSNIYYKRHGNNSINMNNINEISKNGQIQVKQFIKKMKTY